MFYGIICIEPNLIINMYITLIITFLAHRHFSPSSNVVVSCFNVVRIHKLTFTRYCCIHRVRVDSYCNFYIIYIARVNQFTVLILGLGFRVPSHYLEARDSEKKEILTSNLTRTCTTIMYVCHIIMSRKIIIQ